MLETEVPANPAATDHPAAVARPIPAPRRAVWMRRLGNGLIAAGLLLMLGVGGYLAVQMYTNDQATQAIDAQHAQAQGLNLVPPTPVAVSTAAPAGAVVPTAAAAALADNTVHVDEGPLARLNDGVQGVTFAGLTPSKPATRIEIPTVGIQTSVVPVGWSMIPSKGGGQSSQWQVADYAAGQNEGSANPGQIGNIVISGHVDWKGEVFKNLHQVKRGDEVHLFTADREYDYIIQDTVLVLEDGATDAQKRQNAQYMDPTPDQTLTLITCFPYGIDDHRLIVIAKPYDSGLPARPDLVVR